MKIRKKTMILLVAVITFISGCLSLNVQAETINSDTYIIEYTDSVQPRGYYLAEGTSGIAKVSTYTMNATGVTTAARLCDVAVTVRVEKYLEDRDCWVYYTSWQTSNENAYTASISNTIYVDLGYFYRVVSTHTAGTETSSSSTNALWMGL